MARAGVTTVRFSYITPQPPPPLLGAGADTFWSTEEACRGGAGAGRAGSGGSGVTGGRCGAGWRERECVCVCVCV